MSRILKSSFAPWLWLLCYCVGIFLLSSQPNLNLPEVVPETDKIVHFLEYAVLGWLCARVTRIQWPVQSFRFALIFATFFSSLYGVSDEWHQAYIPGRCSDWRDWLADTGGGSAGGFLLVFGEWMKNNPFSRK